MRHLPSHHVLFPRVLWTAQEAGRDLRSNTWLKPPLVQDAHVELHRVVPLVPVLGNMMTQKILKEFVPIPGDYGQSMIDLMHIIEDVAADTRTPQLERDLGYLAAHSIRAQIPLVLEGLDHV